MLTYQIKTHQLNRTYNQPHFFVLNKGLNSGKPLEKPCPNCFVIIAQNNEAKKELFYISMALQMSKKFEYFLKGSVIPFITISDTKKVITAGLKNYTSKQWQIKIDQLKKIMTYEQNLKQQLNTISKLKMALL